MTNKINLNKRAQVTIFIILAIAIVVILVVLLYPNINVLVTGGNPVQQFEKCFDEPVAQALDLVSKQGGYINPLNYKIQDGNKIAYLCYTNNNYEICELQEAFVTNRVETEIKNYIEPSVKACINSVKERLRTKGYTITSNEPVINVSLVPQGVLSEAQIGLTITKQNTEAYDKISSIKASRIYALTIVTNQVLKQELQYGDSDVLLFMANYPAIKFEEKRLSDGSNIYTLTYRETGDKFRFATKNLLTPEGYGI